MYKIKRLKRSLFVLCLSIIVCSISIWYPFSQEAGVVAGEIVTNSVSEIRKSPILENEKSIPVIVDADRSLDETPGQGATYPAQAIVERIGTQLSQGNIFTIAYNNRQVVFVGQTHHLVPFQELKKWLTQEAIAEKLVLTLEGLPRDFSWEADFRRSVGGHGEEPIYGIEDEAALLVEAGIICRNISLGIIENYGINGPAHIVNFSSLRSLGKQVWDELCLQSADENVQNLIGELDPLVKLIQAVPDFQAKLDAFDLVKKQLLNISAHYDSNTWANFYGLYAAIALEHAHSMPSDLRALTMQVLQPDATTQTVREWLNLDSAYREQHFAQAVLWVMAHTDTSLPAVVLVGRAHLVGLLKALVEAQNSTAVSLR